MLNPSQVLTYSYIFTVQCLKTKKKNCLDAYIFYIYHFIRKNYKKFYTFFCAERYAFRLNIQDKSKIFRKSLKVSKDANTFFFWGGGAWNRVRRHIRWAQETFFYIGLIKRIWHQINYVTQLYKNLIILVENRFAGSRKQHFLMLILSIKVL